MTVFEDHRRLTRPCVLTVLAAGTAALLTAGLAGPAAGAAMEYAVPTAQGTTWDITAGSDGAVWFTGRTPGSVGRITTDGQITEYPLPGGADGNDPAGITRGPDGALWFTRPAPGGQDTGVTDGPRDTRRAAAEETVGRITAAGEITEYPLPADVTGRDGDPLRPREITTGPDANLWVTLEGAGALGRITPDGDVTTYPLTQDGQELTPLDVTAGADGNLWVTARRGGDTPRFWLFTVTPDGDRSGPPLVETEHELHGLTVGADGTAWVVAQAESGPVALRIESGSVTEIPLGTAPGTVAGTALDASGTLWATLTERGEIARVTNDGMVTVFPFPRGITSGGDAADGPTRIVNGPGEGFWVTTGTGGSIVRFHPSDLRTMPAPTIPAAVPGTPTATSSPDAPAPDTTSGQPDATSGTTVAPGSDGPPDSRADDVITAEQTGARLPFTGGAVLSVLVLAACAATAGMGLVMANRSARSTRR